MWVRLAQSVHPMQRLSPGINRCHYGDLKLNIEMDRQLWVPHKSWTRENGALQVVPGSHLLGRQVRSLANLTPGEGLITRVGHLSHFVKYCRALSSVNFLVSNFNQLYSRALERIKLLASSHNALMSRCTARLETWLESPPVSWSRWDIFQFIEDPQLLVKGH